MMNIKAKWYWLISVLLVFSIRCKIPDLPSLSIDDISIINKGKYVYKIDARDNAFSWGYDSLVLEIENVHFVGDTTMFVGNMYVMNDKMFDGSQRLFPIIIYKTKDYVSLKCKQDYFSEEHRLLSNFSFQFPFIEEFTYSVDDCDYRIFYDEYFSNYEFNGCAMSDGWKCHASLKRTIDNEQVVYRCLIRFTPNFFIENVYQEVKNKNGYWEHINLDLIRIEEYG